MSKDELWINMHDDDVAEKRVESFWLQLSGTIQTNTFWADEIKLLRDEPEKRLMFAYQYLPLPGAFQEAAIAIRALIRKDRKNKISYDERLFELYHLAVIYSFFILASSIPYSEKLRMSGISVFERIPGGLIYSLPFEYKEVGYDELELLTKTDKKLLVEKWGEPNRHSTLHKKHRTVWDHYENILLKKQEASDKKSREEMKEILDEMNEARDKLNEIGKQQARETKKWWQFW